MSESNSADVNEQALEVVSKDSRPTPDSQVVNEEQSGIQSDDHELSIPSSKSSKKTFWESAKKAVDGASTRASTTGSAVASKAASIGASGVAKVAELGQQAIVQTGAAIEASGAKETIKATTSAVVEKLDEVSGKRLVELLEQKLQIQDSYNDILATRLAEALERIATLEKRIDRLTSQS